MTVWDRQRVWQPIFNRISFPPFTGQLNHAAFFKMCEAKLDEAKAQISGQTPEQARQLYEEALALAPEDNLFMGILSSSWKREGTWRKPSQKLNASANSRHICRGLATMPAPCSSAREESAKRRSTLPAPCHQE